MQDWPIRLGLTSTLRQRLGALVENPNILVIEVDSVALLASDLPDYIEGPEALHRAADGGWSQVETIRCIRVGRYRVPAQQFQYTMSGASLAAKVFYFTAVFLEELQNAPNRVRSLLGYVFHAFQEEPQPSEPITFETNSVKAVIVLLAVLFEKEAQVQ